MTKTIYPEADLQGLVYFGRTTNCVGSSYIFNIEVNGTFAINRMYNELKQNCNWLKFLIYASYVNIDYSLMP